MFRNLTFLLLFLLSGFQIAWATEREDEIRAEMWNSSDKSFQVKEIPDKWKDKSAVIIAQLNRFEYRKPAMVALLRFNEYSHYRIMLLDKNALAEYSEITFLTNRTENSTGETFKVYVGFKIIKPNGKEIIVDHATAVTMERERGGQKQSYKKLAVPGLEIGDIIDYYICEEATRSSATYIYFFDPVIYSLPGEYPIINHKLQFRAERRCFINLSSLNGAPEFKLVTDEAKDEQYYSLEVKDVEAVEDQRWLYQYRELPSIKFRAAYASGKGMRTYDVLLGEPGVAKTSVTKKEVEDMAATMLATPYDVRFLSKYAKSKLKGEKDPIEIAKKAYYFYRNEFFLGAEATVVEGGSMQPVSELKFVDGFSTFLTGKKINNDVVLAVGRNIAPLDKLLMENEIEWLVRVKNGDKTVYFSPFDQYTLPGTIDPLLEGTEAYVMPMLKSGKLIAQKATLPTSTSADNVSDVTATVDLGDLTNTKIAVKRSLTGHNKAIEQSIMMDVYDFESEERSRYDMDESFEGFMMKKRYVAMKEAYMKQRPEYKSERLKYFVENNYDFKTKESANLTIEQTGRYEEKPAFVYSYTFETDELVKKTGPNYLLDIGKLIERQTKIDERELKRQNNIYFDNPRSFKNKVIVTIPAGYTVQGLDKLNQSVETKWGGFTSTAKMEGGKIVVETNKHYDANFVPKEAWDSLLKFLNAAHSFTEQKVLLKK